MSKLLVFQVDGMETLDVDDAWIRLDAVTRNVTAFLRSRSQTASCAVTMGSISGSNEEMAAGPRDAAPAAVTSATSANAPEGEEIVTATGSAGSAVAGQWPSSTLVSEFSVDLKKLPATAGHVTRSRALPCTIDPGSWMPGPSPELNSDSERADVTSGPISVSRGAASPPSEFEIESCGPGGVSRDAIDSCLPGLAPRPPHELNSDGTKANVTEGSLSPEGREQFAAPSETELGAVSPAVASICSDVAGKSALAAPTRNPTPVVDRLTGPIDTPAVPVLPSVAFATGFEKVAATAGGWQATVAAFTSSVGTQDGTELVRGWCVMLHRPVNCEVGRRLSLATQPAPGLRWWVRRNQRRLK